MFKPDTCSLGLGLKFAGVKGSTARTRAQFAVLDEKIAYVAGSGVIVASVDENGNICGQRLFVPNSANEAHSGVYGHVVPKPHDSAFQDESRKDSFGFPVNYTHVYKGTCAESESSLGTGLDGRDQSGFSAGASKLKDKVRAPTCLALSPNGRILAVGESGYQPRILLYSLAADSQNQPFAVIHEHSFGINHIDFSPDSKYFCSLGTMSDGFLHVWKYTSSSVVRRAGNKCSSTVNDLVWHDTGSGLGEIVTLGLRFLKIWSLDAKDATSPTKVAILKGRNLILGNYLESNFQSAVSLNSHQLIIRESTGLYLLSLRDDALLQEIALDHRNVWGLVPDPNKDALLVIDRDFQSQTINACDLKLKSEAESQPKPTLSPSKLISGFQNLNLNQENVLLKASNYGEDHLVFLTGEGEILLYDKATESSMQLVSAPVSPVSGGKRASTGEILIYSKNGHVTSLSETQKITEIAKHELPQTENLLNELTAVDRSSSTLFLGDKYGSLSVINTSDPSISTELVIKAHSSTINDIIYFEVDGVPLLCSISRDRMIQVYSKPKHIWDVLYTIPLHTANLLSVKFVDSLLFVCSADRSISVHEITTVADMDDKDKTISISHKKTISLKTTPLAMDVSDSELVVSSSDRSLSVFDKLTLELKKTTKLYGENSTEPLCVDTFLLLPNNQLAVFCSDRSLRTFNLISGKNTSCMWGHLESVIGLFQGHDCLLSLGSDGCLFKWKLTNSVEQDSADGSDSKSTEIPTPEPDVSPLFAKVTRKFMPTALSTRPAVSPRRASSLSSEDAGPVDPDSPTPRLTSATLKRIEARKKSQSSAMSPSKGVLSQGSPSGKSPLRSKSVSPPKGQTNTSQTPFQKGQTPSRQSALSRSLHLAAKTQSSASSQKSSAPSLPPPTSSVVDAKERSMAYLTMIKSFIKKNLFDEEDKELIKSELKDLLSLLEGSSRYEDLLEKFSQDLLLIMQKKVANS